MAHRLLARRSVSDPTEVAYYHACGPVGTPLAGLVRAAGNRWAVEMVCPHLTQRGVRAVA